MKTQCYFYISRIIISVVRDVANETFLYQGSAGVLFIMNFASHFSTISVQSESKIKACKYLCLLIRANHKPECTLATAALPKLV